MRILPLFVVFACTPADPAVSPNPPSDPVTQVPVATGDAPDFTTQVQGGGSFTLWDHAGDVILIDMSGFT